MPEANTVLTERVLDSYTIIIPKSLFCGISFTSRHIIDFSQKDISSYLAAHFCGLDPSDPKPLKSFRHFLHFFLICIDTFTYNGENCYSYLSLNCLISFFLMVVVNRWWPKAVKLPEKWSIFCCRWDVDSCLSSILGNPFLNLTGFKQIVSFN